MSASDDYLDTPFGTYAQDMEDETGFNPASFLPPEAVELFNERADDAEREAAERERYAPEPGQQHADGPPDPVGGGMSDGQVIHDAAHWLGKAVDGAGEMVGGEFVATGDWSGGILEDDVTPLEHRVVTHEDGSVTADWVDTDGSLIPDMQYEKDNESEDGTYFYYDAESEEYDSGFDDGYQEGYDEAMSGQDDEYYSE